MISEIFAGENGFLIILGLIWIIGAILQDFKRREVDNLWNFSLIFMALAYRAFVSISNGNYWFIINGIIGFGVFFALSNLFYYSRLFAGGDAKLLMALGAILPLSYNWISNLKIFVAFVLLFFALGALYSLVYSFVLVFANFKRFTKEFKVQWKNYNKMFLWAIGFMILWIIFAFILDQKPIMIIGFVVLLFPVLFVYAKSVEESCMVKLVDPKEVTIGDWLYKDIKVGDKKIKSKWEGVSKYNLEIIRKGKKKILIKQGVPFTPSFLFGFIVLIVLIYKGYL
ncbi:MAG: prepilin peptidase [Candidatus Pacearchaeota archaeon]